MTRVTDQLFIEINNLLKKMEGVTKSKNLLGSNNIFFNVILYFIHFILLILNSYLLIKNKKRSIYFLQFF